MKHRIHLVCNEGFRWFRHKNIRFKGYFFDSDGDLYAGERAVRRFEENLHRAAQWTGWLKSIRGIFTLVVQLEDEAILVTDSIRAFPLFIHQKTLDISDDVFAIAAAGDEDPLKREIFTTAGYLPGPETMFQAVLVTDGGTITRVSDKGISTERYLRHYSEATVLPDPALIFEQLLERSATVFKRLIASVQGRCIAVPLSGGYDSRFIVAMLRQLDYKNVITFTYGNPRGREAVVSQQVAAALGYPWYCVEHEGKDLSAYLPKADFFKRAYSGVAAPCFQDFLAIQHLKEQGQLPRDAVIVPGLSGDLLGGSHLKSFYHGSGSNLIPQAAARDIFSQHFNLRYRTFSKPVADFIKNSFIRTPPDSTAAYLRFMDEWNIHNRQMKFINNSCRLYEYHGFEWRLPLWDEDFAQFWHALDPLAKIEQSFYERFLNDCIFSKFNIQYKKQTKSALVPRIKQWIPDFMFYLLRNFYHKTRRDDIQSYLTADFFKKELEKMGVDFDKNNSVLNYYTSLWVLEKTKREWCGLPGE